MDIYVNLKDLEDCIENLNSNEKFLVIKDNLFSMDKIITMKSPEEDDESPFINTNFELSYDDCCKKDVIKISYFHEDDNCITFVKNCQLISEADCKQIWERALRIVHEKNKEFPKSCTLQIDQKEVDNIFYNEVLVFISSKINENDKSDLKDDFISKYELFKEKKQDLTKKTIDTINILYNKIVMIKLLGK